ncbi:MAG: ABC transporter permease subunit [Deltaproteobacteria bacterium]|jgi:molybdate transport system permease protein|nr:ABC transporter permease subunit [Deltaproteobacteria bacterium]MBT4527619.1 ABC transporter permease subunit [Deltaproteobacteria bacterium]
MIFTRLAKFFSILIVLVILSLFLFAARFVSYSVLVETLTNSFFLASVMFSISTAFYATMVSLVLGIPVGYTLARSKLKFWRVIEICFDLPLVLPPLIIGVLLLITLNSPLIKNFYTFVFTPAGAVIAQILIGMPLTIKSAKTAFQLISPIYERVAMTLGARPIKSFYDTTFKMAFPGILGGLILTWLRCIGEFGATLMIGGGIPGRTVNVPINIYLNMSSGDFNIGITSSLLMVIFSFLCIVFIRTIIFNKTR